MASSPRPAVQRIRPPSAPYRVVNRVVRWLLTDPARAGRVGRHLLLLHVTGRRTGRDLVFPVAYRDNGDGRLLVLTNSPWRVNLRDRPDVAVTLLGRRRAARAELVEDPDRVAAAYRTLIEATGHRRAGRRMGIRINVPRTPTHAELAEAARRDGLALIHLDVVDGAR
ncbi:nitroreductase/quinone reductase family protein [Micromonospora siamensis]|uniref:Deazaflavin-dependent oxidoreductase, nitroreductase family n=1 Tax=Micromonospora siamensis TaxID=299152 RepID=A0A1C5HX59_9ACTN|nr:nitroreductase/quinone reductase family protein [Micromonospora siamensis]SCG50542.1 deazaflavin-dependent oxidoreductase, nitroreductase family [Micromonospora siamensis]